MGRAAATDPVAELHFAQSGVSVAVTAGGAGDAVEVNGQWIDMRNALGAAFVLSFTTTLAEGQTLSIAGNMQDATDISGTGAADFGAAVTPKVVATGPAGGGTVRGTAVFKFDVTQSRGFGRIQWTPDLSAGSVDTAAITHICALGGARRLEPPGANMTRLN